MRTTNRLLFSIVIMMTVMTGIGLKQALGEDKSPVLDYSKSDAGMNAAMQRARKTLPRFFELKEKRVDGSYQIKFPLTTGGRTEHIWMTVTQYDGQSFSGVLGNQPVYTDALQKGSSVTTPQSDISDWAIFTDDTIYGAYTVRYALKDMTAEDAAQFKGRFKD